MSFDFINPLMLLGLLGISLPILAHLLSKKKYDIVQWGAMQFLELGRNTRRRLRLEEFLLLLLRIGLIALVALALARPWASGGMLASFVSNQPRDVVFVIDGSYSMGWEGKAVTPHAAAIEWAYDYLEELRPGDTVALLDARDQVRPVIESPTHDFALVREALNDLPQPSGSSNLSAAVAQAVKILSRTSNLSRDVVVLTDGQNAPWSAGDANLWTRLDDLLEQPAVRPGIWVVDVGRREGGQAPNFSLERLQISRELTVPDFPLRIQTKVRYTGGETPITRRVYLEVDGQRLNEKTLTVRLEPDGEASVEFEHRLKTEGSHVLSVVLDADNLPGDNRADAAIRVAEALPVLVVDGDPQLEPSRAESFFARAAWTAASNRTPWIQARTVAWDQFQPGGLQGELVLVLANVPRLSDAQAAAVQEFVARGGGLFITLGNRVEKDAYNETLFEEGHGLLPASLAEIQEDTAEELQGVRVVDSSLELPWLARFRREHDGGFTEARFSHWWKVTPATRKRSEESNDSSITPSPAHPVTPSQTAARLNTGDPLLLLRRYDRGGVVLMTSSLDADWNTLPAKPDYVAFLHEVVFHLAAQRTSRNVEVGESLVFELPEELPLADFAFFGPDETEFPATPGGDELNRLVRLDATQLPGVYEFRPKTDRPGPREHFVVNFDRRESDLTPLNDTGRAQLTQNERMAFVGSLDELKQQAFSDESRAEFWYLLLLVFLGILVFEVVMTRRLVKGGHAVLDEESRAEGQESRAGNVAGVNA